MKTKIIIAIEDNLGNEISKSELCFDDDETENRLKQRFQELVMLLYGWKE